MEIGSGNGYPAANLSNFAPHPFEFRGVMCASMEGFLQSLKFKNPEKQRLICQMVGRDAKFAGKQKKWWIGQVLYWQGEPIDRHSKAYQEFLDEAFEALSKNPGFKSALLASQKAVLKHSIGKNDPSRTVLTIQEFVSRLTKLRTLFQGEM